MASTTAVKAAWRADRARYGPRSWAREQSWWAIAVFRFGQWADALAPGWKRALLIQCYWLAFRVVETVTGVSLDKATSVGPGLRIHHFGGIVVHPDTVIGAGCTLRHGVTLGQRVHDGPTPVVGDDVEFGAFAQVLGGVTIRDRARIGALALVLDDVPADGRVLAPKGIVQAIPAPDC